MNKVLKDVSFTYDHKPNMITIYKNSVLILVVSTIFATILLPATLSAHGNIKELDRHIVGPYEVALGTIPVNPSVGELHLSIKVTEVNTKVIIMDAHVSATAIGPKSHTVEIGPLTAERSLTDPASYEMNTVVNREGMWNFFTKVKTRRGEFDTTFEIKVQNQRSIVTIITFIILLSLLVIIGLFIRSTASVKPNGQNIKISQSKS